jgi:transcriptional regulator with XRE-family HTH domain
MEEKGEREMPSIVKVEAVAKALEVTPRRIQQLAREGMPKIGHGRYELESCVEWYALYLENPAVYRTTERRKLNRIRANSGHEVGVSRLEHEPRGRFVPSIALPSPLSRRIYVGDSCHR